MILNPMVSVVIPTYNRSALLLETLSSVQNQTFKHWECIIVDDGSSDDTEKVIKNLIKIDERFKYFKRPSNYPKGAASCRNYGFESSTGKYIQWLDDDDLLSARKLEFQIEKLEELQDLLLLITCSWDLLWPSKNLELKNYFFYKRRYDAIGFYNTLAKYQTFVPSHSYLVSRNLVEKAGLWNSKLLINQDAEFFSRILINSNGLVNSNNGYVLYRTHDNQRISRQSIDDPEKTDSLICSLELMCEHLKNNNIKAKAYFRWKLLKIINNYWKSQSAIIKEHKNFFKENGIYLELINYYLIKNKIYKMIYPHIKKIKN